MRHSVRFVTLAPVVVSAVLLVTAACGVNTSTSPETMSRDNLPEELGGANPSTTVVPAGEGEIELWFVESSPRERLVRHTVSGPVNPTERVVMETLLDGPGEQLVEEGVLITAIPAETSLTDGTDPELEGNVLVLDLSREFYDANDRPQAFGQVVLTATEIEGVEAVRFTHEGEPRAATDGEGVEREQDEPVRAADYENLVAEGS